MAHWSRIDPIGRDLCTLLHRRLSRTACIGRGLCTSLSHSRVWALRISQPTHSGQVISTNERQYYPRPTGISRGMCALGLKHRSLLASFIKVTSAKGTHHQPSQRKAASVKACKLQVTLALAYGRKHKSRPKSFEQMTLSNKNCIAKATFLIDYRFGFYSMSDAGLAASTVEWTACMYHFLCALIAIVGRGLTA
uniref:Uncharacterized protein n=1 Tax=Solanum lycopersicum TaxID=4081 RepID=A0A3Q7GJ68_SOLLC